jgi:hypothetical protein
MAFIEEKQPGEEQELLDNGVEQPIAAAKTPFEMMYVARSHLIFACYLKEALQNTRVDFHRDVLKYQTGPTEGLEMYLDVTDSNEVVAGALNIEMSAVATSAIVADTAMHMAFGKSGPNGMRIHDHANTSELISAQHIIYMIRCAFAHDPYNAIWQCQNKFQRMISIASIGINFNGRAVHRQPFRWSDIAGLPRYFDLLKFCHEQIMAKFPIPFTGEAVKKGKKPPLWHAPFQLPSG